MAYEKQLSALAHPLRQSILTSLSASPKSVRELTDDFDATQPAVSQHLKVLRDAGLVEVKAQGAKNIYFARSEGLQELKVFLEQHWRSLLNAMDD
ncbi:MAG: metalloregulator ArsR/SmtB family transcription factor [Pseudomonadota bacterium]